MRPIEIALVSALVLGCAAELFGVGRRTRVSVILVAGLLAAWHMIAEGPHFQLLPAYLVLCLLIVMEAFPARRTRFTVSMSAGIGLVLCFAAAVLSYLIPMFSLPKPTGPYAVGTTTLYLTDTNRHEESSDDPNAKRQLVVQVWYPAAPSQNHLAAYRRWAEGKIQNSYQSVLWTNSRTDAPVSTEGAPFPILLFNHGWGGRRTQNTFLTEDLASHGYVVASIDHTYNAARVQLADGRIVVGNMSWVDFMGGGRSAQQIMDSWNKELDRWTADEIFVLDRLIGEDKNAQSPFYNRLRTDIAGAVGHSFGGAASIQVGGADPRIKAAVNLDGWILGGLKNRTANQPILLMYEDIRPDPSKLNSPDPGERTETQLDLYDENVVNSSLKQFGGYRLYIRGTTHEDFTDLPLSSPLRRLSHRGLNAPARMEDMVRSYVLAFFDQELKGKNSPLLGRDKASPFGEVTFESWTPAATKDVGKPVAATH